MNRKHSIARIAAALIAAGAGAGAMAQQTSNFEYVPAASITPLVPFGKSVDWLAKPSRIASAALRPDGYYDVFIMKPDGSQPRLLTHKLEGCPQKHNGNPCFDPTGQYLVFTAQNEALDDDHRYAWRCAFPGAGLGADLYVANLVTRQVTRLTSYRLKEFTRCVIHPQFSNDGSMIAWSERVERGRSFGGGWVIKVGRFTDACKGGPRLTDIVTLTPGEHSCFYEVHDFSPDDSKLLFSGDLRAGQPHTGLDLYELELKNGGRLTRLTHTDTDWDEHAHYSPDGRRIAWMSSKGLDIDYGQLQGFGLSWTQHLKTELWVMNADGTDAHRVTGFNVPGSPDYADGARCIVSDSTWDPDGSGLCVCISAEHNDETMKVSLVRIDLANR